MCARGGLKGESLAVSFRPLHGLPGHIRFLSDCYLVVLGKKDSKATAKPAVPPAVTQSSAASGSRKGSVSIPKVAAPGLQLTPKKDEDDDLPRDLINSPRNNGGPKATAPYRDDALLPPLSPRLTGRKCLVLDLDETLVHSSFKPVDRCDFIVPVEIEGRVHQVRLSLDLARSSNPLQRF